MDFATLGPSLIQPPFIGLSDQGPELGNGRGRGGKRGKRGGRREELRTWPVPPFAPQGGWGRREGGGGGNGWGGGGRNFGPGRSPPLPPRGGGAGGFPTDPSPPSPP